MLGFFKYENCIYPFTFLWHYYNQDVTKERELSRRKGEKQSGGLKVVRNNWA